MEDLREVWRMMRWGGVGWGERWWRAWRRMTEVMACMFHFAWTGCFVTVVTSAREVCVSGVFA